jgi:hypothetical protein
MSNTVLVGTCKNLFCRDHYHQLINDLYNDIVFRSIPGARLRKCTYGENCRGAHSEYEINVLPVNHNFNMIDKCTIDFISIYYEIIDVFKKLKSNVINPELKSRIDNYSSLNFIELLNLWYDLACFHRKEKKESTNRSNIPEFYLKCEDITWPFERITKVCPKYTNLINMIERGSEKPTIWDICCASVNCKEGCHHISNMVCTEDFLSGKCDCLSKEEFYSNRDSIIKNIKQIKDSLSEKEDETGYRNKLTTKKKKSLENKLVKLNSELTSLIRKTHYTDEGFIPFNVQLKKHQLNMDETERKTINIENDRQFQINTSQVKKKIVKPKF